MSLLRLSADEHVLLATMHHIVSDGWSVGIFVRELGTLYEAYAAGKPSPLAPLPVQYADFATWQRRWLSGEVLQTQLAYWRKQLAGVPALLELPTDHPRPAVRSSRGATHSFVLSEELTVKLRALAQQENATLFMTLLAAFKVLLTDTADSKTSLSELRSPIAIAARSSRSSASLSTALPCAVIFRTIRASVL